jgi:putative heme-binding domain-containing protein
MKCLLAIILSALFGGWPLAAQRRNSNQRNVSDRSIPETNPFSSPEDVAAGRRVYLGRCAICHGRNGEGGVGINLTTGQYRMGGSDSQLFRTIQNGIPGSEMPGTRQVDAEIWRLVAYVKSLGAAGATEKAYGDARAGRTVYEARRCSQCHVVGQEGGGLGPELSEIGVRRSLAYLRESIVNPDADIAIKYLAIAVVTASGERISGTRINEDDYSIQIRDMFGNVRSFLKTGVKEIQHPKQSLMPSYKAALSATELDDLVGYLSSLRGEGTAEAKRP